jgi:hypothetical protein
MDTLERQQALAFLGREFLLWLLHHSDVHGGYFDLGEGDFVDLMFENQLVLDAHIAQAEESRLKGGSPAYSAEARKALQLGKLIRKARITLRHGEVDWLFTFDADTFAFSGIKLPAVLTRDEDDSFTERMVLIETLEGLWLRLYRVFLTQRLGARWDDHTGDIRAWIFANADDEPQPRDPA